MPLFLKEDCHIRNPLSAKEDKDNDILRDFIGQEYWNVAKNVKFLFQIFKNLNRINEIMKVWTEFYEIYTLIKYDQVTAERMKELTLDWSGDFLHVYSNEDVTPYIHMLVFHLHEIKELYSEFNLTINEFNLEGLEKKMIL
jgi:hypothetical protein